MRNFYISLLGLFLLTACSKEELFGSKDGPDAYRIQTFQKLTPVENSVNGQVALPLPTNEPTSKLSEVKTASEILDIKRNSASTLSDNSELYNKLALSNQSVNIEKFDSEMKQTYRKQQEEKTTPLDKILGNGDKLIDPITNPEKEEGMKLGIFSF